MVNIESVRSGADKVFSALVFLIAIVFFAVSFSLPASSALLPRGVAFFTVVLDLPVMVGMWRKSAAGGEEKVIVPVYTSAVMLLAYYVALLMIGYIIASLAYIVAVGRLIGLKNWIALIILAVIMVSSMYYLFGVFFAVPLPSGMLFQNFF